MEKAQRSGLPEDAQAAKDLDSMCQRFEKKIHDLELTRMISIQTAPQIRLVQGLSLIHISSGTSECVYAGGKGNLFHEPVSEKEGD